MKKQFLLSIALLALGLTSCQKNVTTPQLQTVATSNGVSNKQLFDAGAPAVIVIIGASTPAGKGANPADSAWVNRLRLTTAQNPTPLTYINLAMNGYTTYQGMPNGFKKSGRPAPDTARNISKALSYHPSLVMISFPSNDIADGYSLNEVMSNYARMTATLDSAKVPYILFGAQPRNLADSSKRVLLKQMSSNIKSLYGNKSNDYFDLLSTSALTIKPELAFGDGIHVNNKGHYLIMQSVLNHPIFQSVIKPVPATPVSSAPIGAVISLKGSTKSFASQNGGSDMYCNRTTASGWEKFTVVDAGNGKIALKCQSKYVSSENGASAIRCDKSSITSTELFDWIKNSDNTISLKGNNGAYISSENGRGPMTCVETSVTAAEKFQIVQ